LADVLHAGIGGGAGHAEHAEMGGERRAVAVELDEGRGIARGMGGPAAAATDHVAGGKPGRVRGDDLAEVLAGHDLADLHRGGVGFAVGQRPRM